MRTPQTERAIFAVPLMVATDARAFGRVTSHRASVQLRPLGRVSERCIQISDSRDRAGWPGERFPGEYDDFATNPHAAVSSQLRIPSLTPSHTHSPSARSCDWSARLSGSAAMRFAHRERFRIPRESAPLFSWWSRARDPALQLNSRGLCHYRPASDSGRTRSSPPLARAAWARSTKPATLAWIASSQSRRTWARSASASSAKRGAIAKLNHPHICSLYDVGPDYLVMEYVEGKPLQGPLPVSEALRLAEQVLDAMEAAVNVPSGISRCVRYFRR